MRIKGEEQNGVCVSISMASSCEVLKCSTSYLTQVSVCCINANLGFCSAVEKTRQVIFILFFLRQHFVRGRKVGRVHEVDRSIEGQRAELPAEVNA